MNTTKYRLLSALALAAASCSPALAQTESEPNDSIGSANGPYVLPATISGVMNVYTDLDIYRITVPQRTGIKFWTSPVGTATCMNQDLVLTVMNSSGAIIFNNDDGPGSLCPLIEYPTDPNAILDPGTYYVQVRALTAPVYPSPYQLHAEARVLIEPLGRTFTYQGILKQGGQPFTGDRDLRFSVWIHPSETGEYARRGLPILHSNVPIENGLISLPLDFVDDLFDGTQLYLQVEVAETNNPGALWSVLERVPLTATPQAQFALKSVNSQRATQADTSAYAQHAATADSAGSADFAATALDADHVPWSGITGKPTGFSDGVDNTGAWTEGAFITTTSKNVGIGTTLPGSFLLAVNGSAAKVGGGSWSTFCDPRLKHDIKPLEGTLDRVLQLRGYTFAYDDFAVKSRLALPGTQIGLMADEVERVFPDWVERDADGYRYVTERATTALMVEALRDLRTEKDTQIRQIRAESEAKDKAIRELTERLNRLEEKVGR